MSDILLNTIADIVKDEMKRKIKQRKKDKSKDQHESLEFVSLLTMPKFHFDWFMDSFKRTSQCSNWSKSVEKSDPESSKVDEFEREIDFESAINNVNSNSPLKSKIHKNTTGLEKTWSYEEFNSLVRSDESFQVYSREDQSSLQSKIDIDSTVVLLGNIDKRIKALSSKQLPDVYSLNLHIKDTLVNVDQNGDTILGKFFTESFPNWVQKLSLFGELSKTKKEDLDDKTITILWNTIKTWVSKYVYLPDWNFTKSQLNQILNSWRDLETIDIRRNEMRILKHSDDIHVYLEEAGTFLNLKRLYLVSNELNESEIRHITLSIIDSHLIKQLEVINLNFNTSSYDYKQVLRDAGYTRSFY